jgi:predicted Rossmann-fold nucleotide-binding protein
MTSKKKNKNFPKSMMARLDWAEKTLTAILKGEKPKVDPSHPDQAWFYEQMIRMHADFFIPEVPRAYVTLPGEGAFELEQKGDTKIHPLGYEQTTRKSNIDLHMQKEGVMNYKILGSDYGFRDVKVKPLKQADFADSFILGRGDFFAMWQFVHFLQAKLSKDHDADLGAKPLVLQNSGRAFWQPVIDGLGLETYEDDLKKRAGFQITSFPNETEDVISQSLGKWASREPKKSRNIPEIPAGSVLLMVTGNSKKVHELQDIMNTQKTGVKVYPFSKFFPKPEEAKELSRTYAGNNYEKMEKAWERLDEMSPDEIEAMLKKQRIDPAKTFLWFDDRGMETVTDFYSAGQFDECREFLNGYKPGPGAEMAHVFKSMSLEDFYARMEKIATGMEKKTQEPVDLGLTDLTTYMVSPILADSKGKRPFYSFFGTTSDELVFAPRPASDLHKYSEHFQRPKNMPDDRTKAEIPGYIETMSGMALAAKAAIRTFGMDENQVISKAMKAEFREKSKGQRWNVGTQYSLMPDSTGHGSSGLIRQLNGGVVFMKGRDADYDILSESDHDVPINEKEEMHVSSALNNFQRFAIDADCFVLTPEQGKPENNMTHWQKLFVFYSLIVGKQIFDPAVSSKPFALLNRKNDQTWEPALEIFAHLHKKSLIGDKPNHLFRMFDTIKKTSDYLKRAMTRYIPDNIPMTHFQEMGAKSPEDLFRVTVFCSASSTNALLRDQARQLGFQLAAYGFALKNGGGSGGIQQDFDDMFDENGFMRGDIRREGLMVETSLGVHEFRKFWETNFDEPAPRNWVESIQCEQTFQSEGLCEFNDRSVVHPNIYHRMDDLADTEAFIVDAGGSGTVQEIAGILMLREAGLLPIENVPLIIINTETGQGRHKSSIYGPLIDTIPQADFKRLNIHVVRSNSEAIELCREARTARGMEPFDVPDFEEILRDKMPADPVQAIRDQFKPA